MVRDRRQRRGKLTRIRFHDYDKIYSIPGLYERIFYEELECQSPQVVSGLLGEELASESLDPDGPAGLRGRAPATAWSARSWPSCGADTSSAWTSSRRPPWPPSATARTSTTTTTCSTSPTFRPAARAELEDRRFNCLVTVAALGFGDIPPRAFAEAFNLVLDDGWIAFNIKEEFLQERREQRLLAADRAR